MSPSPRQIWGQAGKWVAGIGQAPTTDRAPRFVPIRPKSTTITLQMEDVECGAAALSMILEYYGKYVPLSDLRLHCKVSRDGCNATNIVKAAELYNLDGGGFRREIEDFRPEHLPAVIHWKFEHFVVLEGFTKQAALINDPAIGHRKVPYSEFDKSFTGISLEFKPNGEFEPGGKRPSAMPGLIHRCRKYFGVMLFLLLTSLLQIIPTIVLAACASVFMDKIIAGGQHFLFRPVLLVFAAAGATIILLNAIYQYCSRRLQLRLQVRLNTNFINSLLRLPIRFYSQRDTSEVVSRNALNDRVAETISNNLVEMASLLFNMLIYGCLMLIFSWKLTLTGMASTLIGAALVQWIAKRRIEANMALISEQGRATGMAISALRTIESLKSGGQEDVFFKMWSGTYANATNKRTELQASTIILNVAPQLLSSLTIIAVLILGALEVMNQQMSIGELLAFQMLMGQFLLPISRLSSFAGELQEIRGEIERLDDILLNPVDPKYAQKTSGTPIESDFRLRGKVEIKDLCFSYSATDNELFINNFNLSIEPGQRVAIVGTSGSGKSTMARLIAGLVQPSSGKILLDGYGREELPGQVISNSVAMVEQEIVLFEGTIKDNITLWDDSISDEHVIRACKDADILEKILEFPQGIFAELNENGMNFSGGQRQRLEIARALAVNPSLLILDEATSALDPQTELTIDQNIRIRGCTCVIVAHRLSTIRDCDEIIVMKSGAIVERGRHETLWEQRGEYFELLSAAC